MSLADSPTAHAGNGKLPEASSADSTAPSISSPGTAPLTLEQAVAVALTASPDAAAAQQQIAQAEASAREAQAQRRLQVTLNVTGSLSNAAVIQPPPKRETFGTEQNTLTIPLPVGSKPGLAVRQANEQLTAARATYHAARLTIAGQVAAAYYDLLRKQALQEGARQTLEAAQQELSGAQERYRAGDVPQLDVLQAETPVASAQATLAQAETAVVIAREALNDLLGRPLDAPLTLADVSSSGAPLPSGSSLAGAQQAALAVSTNVAAADANVRADEAALASARAYREPSVSLQAIDLHSKDATSFSREDTVQAEVSFPLTDGGAGRAQVQGAQAALAQARAQAVAARRRVLVAVSAAYLNAQSSASQVAATQTALNIAQTTYDKTVLGYRDGLTALADVLAAQNALNQARLAAIQARYDAAAAQTSLQTTLEGDMSAGTSISPNALPSSSALAIVQPINAAAGSASQASSSGIAVGAVATAQAGAVAPTDMPAGNSRSSAGSSGSSA